MTAEADKEMNPANSCLPYTPVCELVGQNVPIEIKGFGEGVIDAQ